MRIRRENKGKDIIVTCGVDIKSPKKEEKEDIKLNEMMENYIIPVTIEMATQLCKAILADFKITDKEKIIYQFNLVSQQLTEH